MPKQTPKKLVRCPSSGERAMLNWNPIGPGKLDGYPEGYPGAAVCPSCQYGTLVVKGTVRKAVSATGREGRSGQLRVHYVSEGEL